MTFRDYVAVAYIRFVVIPVLCLHAFAMSRND